MCTPTRWTPDVGDRVYWRYGETLPPAGPGRTYWYNVDDGRVLSIGHTFALVLIGGRSLRFIALRRLRRTHAEAEAEQFTPGHCQECNAPASERGCTEQCWENAR